MTSKEMALFSAEILDQKKALDIVIIDIGTKSSFADYFVIASASNENHIKALADSLEEDLLKQDYVCKHVEGYHTAEWILIDYADVVVHLFLKENRTFYQLERIWQDGKFCSIHTL